MRVSSRQRAPGSESATNFTVYYDTSDVIDNVFRVVMIRANMLNLFPNIDHFNNTLKYSIDAVDYEVNVPVGQFNGQELGEALNALVGAHFTIAFDPTNKFLITAAATTLVIDGGDVLNTMSDHLGIVGVETRAPGVSTFAGTFPDLAGPKLVYVELPDICSSNCLDTRAFTAKHTSADSGGYLSLLDVIGLAETPYGFIRHWEAHDVLSSDIDLMKAISLRRLNFRLTNGHGQCLTLPPNQECDFILKVFYKPTI